MNDLSDFYESLLSADEVSEEDIDLVRTVIEQADQLRHGRFIDFASFIRQYEEDKITKDVLDRAWESIKVEVSNFILFFFSLFIVTLAIINTDLGHEVQV